MKIAKIVVPLNVDGAFDYCIDKFPNIVPGNLVRISFANKNLVGLVVDVLDKNENIVKNIKDIENVLDMMPFRLEFINFLQKLSWYNIIPIGLVFKLVFSEKLLGNDSLNVSLYSVSNCYDEQSLTKKQKVVLDYFKCANEKYTINELKSITTKTIINNLIKNGILIKEIARTDYSNFDIDLSKVSLHELSEDQTKVYDDIQDLFSKKKPILLEGATGSGKTEIYFHLFYDILKNHAESQLVFIIPEIALTNQFIDRFKSQFNSVDVAIWHSEVGDSKKRLIWNGIIDGKIRVVIGTRSSLFLPFKNLSLIVLDEEHDGSYKQTDNGCYNARDMAVLRAQLEQCPIILGSATPSIESLVNVDKGKYNRVKIVGRFGNSSMPNIEIIDLKKDKLQKNRYLSKKLIENISNELANEKQVLLFMNRRGYAPMIICNECGYKFICPNCSTALTVHKKTNNFVCHQCGYRTDRKNICPACGKENSLIFFGPGVEKIENEVRELFPEKNSVIITSDTVQNTTEIRNILDRIMNGGVDIIIGTQMITKGYDFPNITLVGVLDADASLFGANFRSAERTYQLLTQVTGRAGRREYQGKAIVQSYSSDNILLQSLVGNNRDNFIEFEKENRKLGDLPPYGKMVLLILSGKSEISIYKKAKELVSLLPNNSENVEIYGPIPASPYKVSGNFRFRILIKTTHNVNIQKLVLSVLDKVKIPSNIKLKIDVDPYFIV